MARLASDRNSNCSVMAKGDLWFTTSKASRASASFSSSGKLLQSDTGISASEMKKLQLLDPIESVTVELNYRLTSPLFPSLSQS